MDRLFRSTPSDISGEDYSSTPVTEPEAWVVAIEQAEYVKEYVLRLKFNDGKEIEIDFEPSSNNRSIL